MGISGFKLPFISPLAGSTLSNLLKVLKGNRVAPRYYPKVMISFVFSLIASILSCLDRWTINKTVNKFTFKESPVFIIGFWRSGTTFMHQVLSLDPAAGFVDTYQAVFPHNLKSKWLFKTFMKIFIPRQQPGDLWKLSTDLPQEDEYAVSNTCSHSFYHFFYFPSGYRQFFRQNIRFAGLYGDGLGEWNMMYRELVIKALINTGGTRAILKNPVHTGRIPVILDIFPNARFICMIRNPVNVYLSTRKFFSELIPTLQLETFDPKLIPDMILDIYELLFKAYLSNKALIEPGRLMEIRFEEFIQHPLATVKSIYSGFSMHFDDATASRISDYLKSINHVPQAQYSISKQELDHILPRIQFALRHWNYDIPEELEIRNSAGKEQVTKSAELH